METFPCFDREDETKEDTMTDETVHIEDHHDDHNDIPVTEKEIEEGNIPQPFEVVLHHCYNEFNRMVDYLHNGLSMGLEEGQQIISKSQLKSNVLLDFQLRVMKELGLVGEGLTLDEAIQQQKQKIQSEVQEDVSSDVPVIETVVGKECCDENGCCE